MLIDARAPDGWLGLIRLARNVTVAQSPNRAACGSYRGEIRLHTRRINLPRRDAQKENRDMSQEFAGKTVIVTGAGRDIGRAVAVHFGAGGANVAVNYRSNDEEAQETVSQVTAAGGKAVAVKADVTNRSDVERMVNETKSAFGEEIHALVNNAGGLVRRVPLVEMTDEHWDEVITLNLTSVFYVCRAVVPSLVDGGAIVNVSSLAARDGGGPGAIAYATSKGGIVTFTRALAKELSPRLIRVNTVDPGMIATRFHDVHTKPEVRKLMPSKIPLKREGKAEEVADAIGFLASDRSSYITGEAIQINGGLFFL